MPKHAPKSNASKTTESVKKANGGSASKSGVNRLKQAQAYPKVPVNLSLGGFLSKAVYIGLRSLSYSEYMRRLAEGELIEKPTDRDWLKVYDLHGKAVERQIAYQAAQGNCSGTAHGHGFA
jgi:hypothetical protein